MKMTDAYKLTNHLNIEKQTALNVQGFAYI